MTIEYKFFFTPSNYQEYYLASCGSATEPYPQSTYVFTYSPGKLKKRISRSNRAFEMIIVLISALTLGQVLLAAFLFKGKARQSNLYAPLVWFFLTLAFTQFYFLAKEPIYGDGQITFLAELTMIKQLFELNLAPLFWIFIRELTAEQTTRWRKADVWHFVIPLIASLSVAFIFCVLGAFKSGQVDQSMALLYVDKLNSTLNIVILIQFLAYAAWVIRRLIQYQRKLMNLFSDIRKMMNLGWFRWFVVIILFTIAIEVVAQILNVAIDIPYALRAWNSLLRALIIYSLVIWSLDLTPDLMLELSKTSKLNIEQETYKKSALTNEQLADVAAKIRNALETEKLYRDSDLSLRKLSQEINVIPNYISQALSSTINETFFDYVNRLRVQEAKNHLATSSNTVSSISSSVGFNSRSSFYVAFKKLTGKTPKSYRRENPQC